MRPDNRITILSHHNASGPRGGEDLDQPTIFRIWVPQPQAKLEMEDAQPEIKFVDLGTEPCSVVEVNSCSGVFTSFKKGKEEPQVS